MEKEKYTKTIKNLLYIIVFLWAVFVFSCYFPGINRYGIVPRDISGLPGILFAPFLHLNLQHIGANSIGLFIFGLFLITLERNKTYTILAALIIIGGAGTWLIGRSDVSHIGASGVIYGIFGYVLTRGFFKRDFKSILISVLVLFLYGGMVYGVLSFDSSLSWESHLCGFLSGILLASSYGRK